MVKLMSYIDPVVVMACPREGGKPYKCTAFDWL